MTISKKMGFLGCLFLCLLMLGCAGGPQSASFGEHVDDSVITSKVKTALLRSPGVSGLDISVQTFKGRVQLNGLVENAQQIEEATKLAREVNGVVTVENNLALK